MTLGDDFARIVEGARGGDQECLTALYRENNARILHYLKMRYAADADDLASETWLSVARSIGTFSGDENGFRRWLFTIARNHVIAHYRKAGRDRSHPTDNETLGLFPSSEDVSEAVSDRMAARELIARLVACLPGDQAEVVRLKVVAGLSTDEIAEVIGKKPGNVRVMLHRALRRLAAEMPEAVSETGAGT